MPASKYKTQKGIKWLCKFYYTDYSGKRKQKLKRGFDTQKDAKEYERTFLNREADINDMLFSSLVTLYFEDMQQRLKETSIYSKSSYINRHILPFFGDKTLSSITAIQVRNWQNELLKANYKENTLKNCQEHLSSLFNYAVKYYNLKENPCKRAGTIQNKENKTNKSDMKFYTLEEYKQLIQQETMLDYKVIFDILFYSGCRIGELMALTASDIDFENNTININKTLTKLKGKDIITVPKTQKSIRVITMFPQIMEEVKEYLKHIYGVADDTRIIQKSRRAITERLKQLAKLSKLHKIRVHDLRHSHASLLISKNIQPLAIAERLGHENIQTTLNTYSHLYPNKQNEIASLLQGIF